MAQHVSELRPASCLLEEAKKSRGERRARTLVPRQLFNQSVHLHASLGGVVCKSASKRLKCHENLQDCVREARVALVIQSVGTGIDTAPHPELPLVLPTARSSFTSAAAPPTSPGRG